MPEYPCTMWVAQSSLLTCLGRWGADSTNVKAAEPVVSGFPTFPPPLFSSYLTASHLDQSAGNDQEVILTSLPKKCVAVGCFHIYSMTASLWGKGPKQGGIFGYTVSIRPNLEIIGKIRRNASPQLPNTIYLCDLCFLNCWLFKSHLCP